MAVGAGSVAVEPPLDPPDEEAAVAVGWTAVGTGVLAPPPPPVTVVAVGCGAGVLVACG